MKVTYIHKSIARAALGCGPPRKLAHPEPCSGLGFKVLNFLNNSLQETCFHACHYPNVSYSSEDFWGILFAQTSISVSIRTAYTML